MSDVRQEIQKRHTLNWLIQGASQHAGLTFHHLVRDELNGIHPKLVPLYDKLMLVGLLQYWNGLASVIFGRPKRFWAEAQWKVNHPFFGHPLLARYGGMLAEAGRVRAVARCKEKGVILLPVLFWFQVDFLVRRLRRLETRYWPQLLPLASQATSIAWGISRERFDAHLVTKKALDQDHAFAPSKTFQGEMFLAGLAGYSRIVRRNGELIIVAKAINWPLLATELVKGTAELIGLHGLNQLDDDTYRRVMRATDRYEIEPWMLQSGGELWRRVLESLPDGVSPATLLMRLAQMPADELQAAVAKAINGGKLSSSDF